MPPPLLIDALLPLPLLDADYELLPATLLLTTYHGMLYMP